MRGLLSFAFVLFLSLSFRVVFSQVGHPDQGFKENKGQWYDGYKYRYDVGSFSVFLEQSGWFYYLSPPAAHDHSHGEAGIGSRSVAAPRHEDPYLYHGISLSFVAPEAPILHASRPHKAYYNYFLGSDKRRWASGVRSFRSVWYCGIYDYVDAEVSIHRGGMKYNFTVYPGGNPDEIALRLSGSNGLYVLNGRLYIETAYGNMVEQIPVAYQLRGDEKIPVSCHYQLKDARTVAFRVEDYDPSLTLVIDPELIGASQSGSTVDNRAYSACYDAEGNVYLSGVIADNTNCTTTGILAAKAEGVFQRRCHGTADICIIKFNDNLSDALFFTYLGGEHYDAPISTLVDEARSYFFLLGRTNSHDFPTTDNAFQSLLNATDGAGSPDEHFDFVVSKISLDGKDLAGSTLLGGTDDDGGLLGDTTTLGLSPTTNTPYSSALVDPNALRSTHGEIALASDGGPVSVSYTTSSDFPGNPVAGHRFDAVLFKMSPDLEELSWSRLLGGRENDIGTSVVLSDTHVYVGGHARSVQFLAPDGFYPAATNRALSPARVQDGFVVSIALAHLDDPTLASGVSMRFFGTPSFNDRAYFLDLDEYGDLYIMGQTHGNYPAINTRGRYHRGGYGHFIHKVSPNLSTDRWAITFGSVPNQPQLAPAAFQVDNCERIYVTGWGGTNNAVSSQLEVRTGEARGPTVPYDNLTLLGMPVAGENVLKSETDGHDFYSMVLPRNAVGDDLLYATFFGGVFLGDHTDGGTSRYDKDGVVYQALCACYQASRDITFGNRATIYGDYPAYAKGGEAFAAAPGMKLTGRRGCNMTAFKIDFGGLARPSFTTNTPDGELPGVEAGCAPTTIRFSPQGGSSEDRWQVEKYVEDMAGRTKVVVYARVGSGMLDYTFEEVGVYEVSYFVFDDECSIERVFSKEITIGEGMEYEIAEDVYLCGENVAELHVAPVNPVDNVEYTWTPEARIDGNPDGPRITTAALPEGRTVYDVLIEQGVCRDRRTVEVFVAKEPEVSVEILEEGLLSCQKAGGITFNGVVSDADTFHWDMGDGTALDRYENVGHVRHHYAKPGTYTVQLVGESGGICRSTAAVEVSSTGNVFPNVLTPNGDGKNDFFVLPDVQQGTSSYELRVYDRLGNKVYESADYKNDWAAEGLPSDVYFYALTITKTQTVCKSWVHLLR